MLGAKRSADLDDFIKKPVFSQGDITSRMSLLGAANNRYSKTVLEQAFKLEDPVGGGRLGNKKAELCDSDSSELLKQRIITFQRSEIIFNNRQSIMLNLRDISMSKAQQMTLDKIEHGKKVNTELANELQAPFSTIESSAVQIV